jgi:hypothetical protein
MRTLDTMTRQAFKVGKVQWSWHFEAEATWEREDTLKEEFPDLFEGHSESRGRDLI